MESNYYVDKDYDEFDIIEKVQNMIANGFYLDGEYVSSFEINIQFNMVNKTTIIDSRFFNVEVNGILSKDAIGNLLPFIFNDGNAIDKVNIYDEPYYTNLNRNKWISKFQFIFKNDTYKIDEKDIYANEIIMNFEIIDKTSDDSKRVNHYYFLTIIDKYYDEFKRIEDAVAPIIFDFKPTLYETYKNNKELVKTK